MGGKGFTRRLILAETEVVRAFEHTTALAADDGQAVAADQRTVGRPLTPRAIEIASRFRGGLWVVSHVVGKRGRGRDHITSSTISSPWVHNSMGAKERLFSISTRTCEMASSMDSASLAQPGMAGTSAQ